jgi:DNA modification methylase/DNA-binding XRE family transcriptional regulator/DNA-directed RNA polymerase subunit RPC12/RpoP
MEMACVQGVVEKWIRSDADCNFIVALSIKGDSIVQGSSNGANINVKLGTPRCQQANRRRTESTAQPVDKTCQLIQYVVEPMPWSAHSAIRLRREQLGLSQTDLAQRLGVTKSLLSHVEAGKRQPTEEQIGKLAKALQLPPDLLSLSADRLPEDVRDFFEADAAMGVAAVRQRSEENVIRCPKIPEQLPTPKTGVRCESGAPPLPERIDVTKTSSSYRAHSYHTKVPPDAIVPFIRAFTRPGDTIVDPFCGSGMTGVAALTEGRNALLSDLSPAAVHISRNYTTACDPDEFREALVRVEKMVEPTIGWLYRPVRSDSLVEYTTWSDVFRCPACRNRIVYWEAVKKTGSPDGDGLNCTRCALRFRKADLEWVAEEPVVSHTSSAGSRINSHIPTPEEAALIEGAVTAPIPYWIPTIAFGPEREMWRAGHRAMGISDVSAFFTRRNLHALAALRHAIACTSAGRVREALLFAFTGCVNRASRRYQWNAKRPTNVMTGTLYISSLRYEWNVWSLFMRKAAGVLRYYRDFPKTPGNVQVFQRSATDLSCLPDCCADMVFMDPPFGSNIFYADSSLLWESWLGTLTDESAEIVVNKHRSSATGGKTLDDYAGLMKDAFVHAARILKPGGRAVLAFSNSDDQVWHAIQKALVAAGFSTLSVHVLNKGQPSIKGVKGVTGKENVTCLDLVLCLEHNKKDVTASVPFPPPGGFVDGAIREAFSSGLRRNDEIYSAVIRAVVQADYSVSGITMPMIEARSTGLLPVRGDGLTGPESAVDKTKNAATKLMEGYLPSGNSLPRSKSNASSKTAIPTMRIPGGRNSTFYMAHSYHTKVPPEAITPFLEYYTKPGDVVLDPFCGSGMTGVAAALSGRRAILNDLSPAAVHLSWNHTRPCDPEALVRAFQELEEGVKERFDDLYETKHRDGSKGLIHWTLWSTRHRCAECSTDFLLWDAIDRKSGRLGRTIKCPNCSSELRRFGLKTLGSVPAWISYELRSGRRCEKAASAEDVRRSLGFARETISAWFPCVPLGRDREMYLRCALHRKGVSSVADLYTARNLEALAVLWQEIVAIADERVRQALAFAFTNTAWHGTRMRRFNARGGQRPLTGTLYIPQLSSEVNVLEVMRNKVKQLARYYRNYRPGSTELPAIMLGSATELSTVADSSIDYVFTDPPFGSNIFYADCNLVWESWLGKLTDPAKEAVVNRSLSVAEGGKSVEDYKSLMAGAMQELVRVLKPGGWATIVFHSTDSRIWEAIRDSAGKAGFEFHEATSLDRRQQSHKGYKGRAGKEDVAHFDVVFNLRKPISKMKTHKPWMESLEIDLESLVAAVASERGIRARGLQGIHAEVMRRLASTGTSIFVDYSEVRAIWERVLKGPAEPAQLEALFE